MIPRGMPENLFTIIPMIICFGRSLSLISDLIVRVISVRIIFPGGVIAGSKHTVCIDPATILCFHGKR